MTSKIEPGSSVKTIPLTSKSAPNVSLIVRIVILPLILLVLVKRIRYYIVSAIYSILQRVGFG